NSFESINSRLKALELKLSKIERYINMSLDKYEQVDSSIKKKDQELANSYKKVFGGIKDTFYDEIKGAALGFNPRDYLLAGFFNEFGFKFIKDKANGTINIKLNGKGFTNNKEFMQIRDKLTEYLGGTSKWDKEFVEKLNSDRGLALFDINDKVPFKKNINKFKNSNFESLIDSIDNISDGLKNNKFKNAIKMGSSSFKDEVSIGNIIDDFNIKSWKGANNTTKVTKGLGIVGTVLTVGGNLDNFVTSDGKVQIDVDTTADFVVDTGVDIVAGAGAAAIGSTVGSFFLPPLGTVVGLGVGVVAGTVINTEFGDPPKSLVDIVKDGANAGVDTVIDSGKNLISGIGNKLSSVFW
ncbi:hypothetical protein, partial [uncultured Clostridium sp.]